MPTFVSGSTRIYYEDIGDGFPLFLIPGGGLNSTVDFLTAQGGFDAVSEFKGGYRCIAADLRNTPDGRSTGPFEADRPWDAFTDDHLALLDHLGVSEFLVMGFCIGAPLAFNLIRRAGSRVVAAVLAQPSGFNPAEPDFFVQRARAWESDMRGRRADLTAEIATEYIRNLYDASPDFVFTVSRAFVRNCETPLLVLPDDTVGHPYQIGLDIALLAPNAQMSFFPWKSPGRIRVALRHVHMFLGANSSSSDGSAR